ncbi:hypothetical protein DRP04_07665 [Archaeoglobales archaeon]|nr:MAG: hypothetical protein DRP04_07665 [Archaeoglobales archaeon]
MSNRTCFDFLTKIVNVIRHKLYEEDYKLISNTLWEARDELLCDWLEEGILKGIIDNSYDKNKMREFIKLCLQKVIESGFWDTEARTKARQILDSLFARSKIKIRVSYEGEPIFCNVSIRSSIEDSNEIVSASGYSPFEVILDAGEYRLFVTAETEDGVIRQYFEFSTDEKEWNVELGETDITEWKVIKVKVDVKSDSDIFNVLKENALVVVFDKFGRVVKKGRTDENGIIRFQKTELNSDELELRVYPSVQGVYHILEEDYFIETMQEKLDLSKPIKTVTIKVKKRKRRDILKQKFDDTEVGKQVKATSKIIPKPNFRPTSIRISEWLGKNKPDILPFVRDFVYNSLGSDYPLYLHQVRALDALCDGKDVLVCAPNASGKTEIPLIYTLRKLIEIGHNGVPPLILAIYPTKALARDQEERWKEFLVTAHNLGILDGAVAVMRLDADTMKSHKDYLRKINELGTTLVALSNPSFILSVLQGNRWGYYFGSRVPLLIVVDEVHFYSSKDLTLLVRMLEHIIQLYGSEHLRLVFLSATIGNPNEFRWNLGDSLGREIKLIEPEYEGSGEDKRYVWIVRVKNENEAESVLTRYLEDLLRYDDIDKTIVFVPNRNIAERLAKNLSQKVRPETLVQCHLGDMSYEEREEVEEKFVKGLTKVLFTVKTLEVGINVGDVRRIIHMGLPPSLNDFVQREGRVSRRGGDSESIILVTNTAEERRAEEYVERLKDLKEVIEFMHRPIFKPDSELIRLINERISKKFPREVSLPGGWKLRIGFYSQDKSRFYVKGVKIPKEIRKQDVIYRYLPGSIRRVKGKDYVVSGIQKNKILLKWINNVFEIWDCVRFNILDLVKTGMVFTVSDVNRTFETLSKLDFSGLKTIKIVEEPEGVKLVQKYEKEVYDEKLGRYVKQIVFRCIDAKELDPELKEELRFEYISRGHIVALTISKDSELVEIIRNELSKVYNDLSNEHKLWFTKQVLEEYAHLATHLILNIVSEIHQWRLDEIQHDIEVKIRDQAKIINILYEIVNLGKRVDIPIEVQIALTNEVDLVQDVDWLKVSNKISEIKQKLLSAKSDEVEELCKDVIAGCYGFRCFTVPYTLELLLNMILESPESRIKLLYELRDNIITILTIAERIVQEITGIPTQTIPIRLTLEDIKRDYQEYAAIGRFDIARELDYLYTQGRLNQKMHSMIEKSLKRLESLGYPREKIEGIRGLFS